MNTLDDDEQFLEQLKFGAIGDENLYLLKALIKTEQHRLFFNALCSLSWREHQILTLSFGLNDTMRRTDEDIAQLLGGMTRRRVSHVRKTALASMSKELKASNAW